MWPATAEAWSVWVWVLVLSALTESLSLTTTPALAAVVAARRQSASLWALVASRGAEVLAN